MCIRDSLQGGMLAPHLFVIVVDYILRQSIDGMNKLGLDVKPSNTNRDPAKYLTDLDYMLMTLPWRHRSLTMHNNFLYA